MVHGAVAHSPVRKPCKLCSKREASVVQRAVAHTPSWTQETSFNGLGRTLAPLCLTRPRGTGLTPRQLARRASRHLVTPRKREAAVLMSMLRHATPVLKSGFHAAWRWGTTPFTGASNVIQRPLRCTGRAAPLLLAGQHLCYLGVGPA